MAQVKLEGVGKVYPGDVTAVTDFNLDVADGEFVSRYSCVPLVGEDHARVTARSD